MGKYKKSYRPPVGELVELLPTTNFSGQQKDVAGLGTDIKLKVTPVTKGIGPFKIFCYIPYIRRIKKYEKSVLKYFSLTATSLSLLSSPSVFADVKMGAKMLLDYNYYDGVHHQEGRTGSGNEIRLVRLYFIGKFDQHWENKLQIQISENDGSTKTVWKEAFLKYNGLGPFDITIGKRKEPFGLQMLVNAERVLFLERTMMSSSFAPERSIGLTLSSYPNNSSFEMGVYHQGDNGNPSYAKGNPEADNPEKILML
ncbi:Phosphate-selective porin O and P [Beggiatoa sp. PS]|nr:Phosphate-selective porin O and P [Beggiatoa sp. PS]